jgi:predicted nuclease of predicted toxin-antitoxin system
MGTLASALQPVASALSGAPRIYADANRPAGVVTFMRQELGWDVLFVIEHDDLRRARDVEHFHRARDFGRTLITLDRDFFDDERFPLSDSPGIVVLSAPDEPGLMRELRHLDRTVIRVNGAAPLPLPLRGRRLALTPDLVTVPPPE